MSETAVHFASTKRMGFLGLAAAVLSLLALLAALTIPFDWGFRFVKTDPIGWSVFALVLVMAVFFAACAFVILSKARQSGPAIEVGEAGYRDYRLGSHVVPWSAIKQITILNLVPDELKGSGALLHLKSIGLTIEDEALYLDKVKEPPAWVKKLGNKDYPAYLSLLTGLKTDADTIIADVKTRAAKFSIPFIE